MFGLDSLVVPVVCAVVEFGIKGNEKDVEAKLDRPSLPATMLFNDRQIQGHHQGLRARSEGKRSWKSGGTLRYKVEASGEGKFNSPELAYVGNFYRGKFHDLSGDAKCSFGPTQRFTGGFEEGHMSGPGVMENYLDSEWRVGFRGTWKTSRPHTGTHYDSAGKPMMTVHEGIMTGVGSASSKDGPTTGSPVPSPVIADRMPPVPSTFERSPMVVVPIIAPAALPSPSKTPGQIKSADRHRDSSDSSVPDVVKNDPSGGCVLLQAKLAKPELHLSLEDGLTVLKQCVELGSNNAQRIAGRTAVVVMGNTGAGKSTFLNFLAGCTMESKSKKSLGIKGIGNVVVVKPVSEGGRRDELVKIGHGKISQTFLPNVLIDDETELCFCDCPGFLDNRGAEINIANAVNLITTLSQAKEVKVIILISYDTIKADRGKGLSELITVCTKLFGSADKLKENLQCLLIGCSLFDPNSSVEELKNYLKSNAPPIVADLVERLFLVDVLASRECWWDREECIEQIRSLPAITNPADVFHTVLLASDEKKLIAMGMEMKAMMEDSLSKSEFVQCLELYRTLELLSAINHSSVERIIRDCYLAICKHFVKQTSELKEYCHLFDFAEAKHVLQILQAAATVFRGEEWAEVLPVDQLLSYYSGTKAMHAEQVQRDLALQLQLKQAGDQIDLLTAALEATKQEAIRKEKELLERFEASNKELAEQLEHSNAMFLSTQQALQEELSARLLAKEEETKLAYELRQQDVIDRLAAEKHAIEEAYRQQLESSKRMYEADLATQKNKEQAFLADQQRVLEEARKEKELAAKRIKELEIQKLLFQTNLLSIAQSGDALVLQQLNELDALDSLVGINKIYPFKQHEWSAAYNLTALMIASSLGHTAVVEILLKVPLVDVNLQNDHNGSTAFMFACEGGCVAAVQALLADARVEVNLRSRNGRTALIGACCYGRTAVVQDLLADARVEVNLHDENRYTALMRASINGRTATVQALLVDPRVEVNQQDKDGWTALMYASSRGRTPTVQALLADARVDVNLQAMVRYTALMWASRKGHTAVVQALLADARVEVNLQNKGGWTALMWASLDGHTATVQALLADSRVDVNLQNMAGNTALVWASYKGHTATVQALLADARVDVNLQYKGGWTALIWASCYGRTTGVQALLADPRVEVNLQDKDGYTALMRASNNGHTEVVHALLADARMEVNLSAKDGYTALMRASDNGHTDVVQALLADARMEVNLSAKYGWTALMLASFNNGHTATVQALLADSRVEVNLQDNDGWTALIFASDNGHTSTLQALLADARVDINLKNKDGQTALDLAKEHKKTDIIPLLQAKGTKGKWRLWG